MKKCAVCHEPVVSGVVVHSECLERMQKAYEESQKCATVVLLIPARTDTSYFHDYIYGKAEIRFVRGRLRFEDEAGRRYDAAPFPSMVVVYRGGMNDGTD